MQACFFSCRCSRGSIFIWDGCLCLAVLLMIVIVGYHHRWLYDHWRQYHYDGCVDAVHGRRCRKGRHQGGANLVVVASGAAAYGPQAGRDRRSKKLLTARPELAWEIRLLSTVSGGSVAPTIMFRACSTIKGTVMGVSSVPSLGAAFASSLSPLVWRRRTTTVC